MKYTEKIHAQRLLKILRRKRPCNLCPAGPKRSLVGYTCSDHLNGRILNETPRVEYEKN